METWKDIAGSKHYSISNLGRIKRNSHKRIHNINKTQYLAKEKILKPSNKNTKKYWRIRVYYNDGSRMDSIHRLVAKAFLPNPNNYPQVNHIDGNKNNNNVENLEWCTNLYNMKHAIDSGLRDDFLKSLEGTKSHLNKHSEETILRIPILIKEGNSYTATAKILGISTSLISEIKKGNAWKHLNLVIPESSKYKKKR